MSDWTRDDARAPLLPPWLAGFVQRRGAEAAGLVLALCGLALAAALVSYDLRDPSWFVATAEAPRNWLGAPGALVADPLWRSLGVAAWGAPALLLVWGLRLILHRGEERVWSRLTLGVLGLPVIAAFAAAHAPWGLAVRRHRARRADRRHGAGGDAARAPIAPSAALPWLTLALGALALAAAGYAAGLDRAETRALGRGFAVGLRDAGLWIFGGARAAVGAVAARLSGPRSARVAPPDPVGRARREPVLHAMTRRRRRSRCAGRAPPPKRARRKSRQAEAEAQPSFDFVDDPERYDAPPLALLQEPSREQARRSAPRRSTTMRGCWNRCSTITACAARSAGAARPGGHALRTRPGAGPQGVARHRPLRRHRPLDVRHRLPRLDRAGAQRDRRRIAERHPREGAAARDAVLAGLWRRQLPAGARAGQGHRRRAGGGQPRAHAASADRGHHRFGQVGRDQHHDPVAALPAAARGVPHDHDRPEDAGAVGL
jgi:hypothetical protein